MRKIINILFYLSLVTFISFAEEETQNPINADTLQGLTSSAFITTNDFETLKLTIERLKSHSEACADGIVDLQLGLSSLSNEERLVREKDLGKILEDYASISSEFASISSVENQEDRAGGAYALQTDLEALESELTALQNHVQMYLGHLKAQNETWYLTTDGALLGTNGTMAASPTQIHSTVLIGQTFRVKNNTNIRNIKIKAELSAPPYDCVFLSPYSPTIATNTFVYANSRTSENSSTYSYGFNDYPASTNAVYIFGVRGRNNYSHIYLNKCNDAYAGETNCLWTGTGSRYSLDALSEFDLIAQPAYDLCFDIDFTSVTNLIIGKDGIEIKNDASLTIDGERAATAQEVNARIAEASLSIYHSLSNHVFGTSSIANSSVTTEKIANDAITTAKIQNSAITTSKIADNAITESKLAAGAVNASKISDGAVTTNKIANGSIVNTKIAENTISGSKIQSNAISSSHILAQAITSEKVETNAIQMFHFSEPLKSNLVLSSGGTVTGKLDVCELEILSSGDWVLGATNRVGNLIIANSNAVISSTGGDLRLQASSGKIDALNFVNLAEIQTGSIVIPAGLQNYYIEIPDITEEAVVLLTPCQSMNTDYWVEINMALGRIIINLGDEQQSDCKFYYCITRK